jgi:hypothetical protein
MGRHLVLLTNIRLVQKEVTATNTLAYKQFRIIYGRKKFYDAGQRRVGILKISYESLSIRIRLRVLYLQIDKYKI